MRKLDIDTWKRKDQYFFFKDYSNPLYSIRSQIDVSKLLPVAEENKITLFRAYMYLSLKIVNEIEEFRYRIRGDEIVIHDTIHAGSIIPNEDETLSFGYFDFCPDFAGFNHQVEKVLKRHRQNNVTFDWLKRRDDVVYYSVMLRNSFTSLSQCCWHKKADSTPRISFGPISAVENTSQLPVSVEVNYALIDVLHVDKFFKSFQNAANSPREHLA